MKFFIEKNTLCEMASCSLQGMLLKYFQKKELEFKPQELTLVFSGSSAEYCRKNGGPELLIMPDYVPFFIIESVIEMQQQGWKISVELNEN